MNLVGEPVAPMGHRAASLQVWCDACCTPLRSHALAPNLTHTAWLEEQDTKSAGQSSVLSSVLVRSASGGSERLPSAAGPRHLTATSAWFHLARYTSP